MNPADLLKGDDELLKTEMKLNNKMIKELKKKAAAQDVKIEKTRAAFRAALQRGREIDSEFFGYIIKNQDLAKRLGIQFPTEKEEGDPPAGDP